MIKSIGHPFPPLNIFLKFNKYSGQYMNWPLYKLLLKKIINKLVPAVAIQKFVDINTFIDVDI